MEPSEAERQDCVRRMQELFAIARQRYLDAGGDPLRPATEQFMTEAERQEFLTLSRQVIDEKARRSARQNPREQHENPL